MLHVFMAGRVVGVIDDADRARLRFDYDDAWMADPDATPLSVSMPLQVKRHSHTKISPYLWGLLPDNERVIERWARDYQCSATNVTALLGRVGAEVAGGAQYLPEGEEPDEGAPGDVLVLTEAEVAEHLRSVRADGTGWHARSGGRWSLAGAQGKIALHLDDDTDRWGVPSGATPTTHILKPAIAGLDDHDLNEHLCLTLAGALGLPVARTEIRHFDDERALVVRRYDRVRHEGRLLRVHQEDLCQALSVHPAAKYQHDGGPSVEDVISLLRSTSAGDPTPDIDTLLRAVAFNWLVLGTDAHAKNYSLLLSGDQVRLAPLYDIASAAPQERHRSKVKMAQKVGGESRAHMVRRRHWERLAAAGRVDADRLVDDIRTMVRQIPDLLSTTIGREELFGDEGAAAQALLDGLTPWLRDCDRSLDEAPRSATPRGR